MRAGGELAGEPFEITQAVFRNGTLTLQEGEGESWERELTIFLFLNDDESLDRRTLRVETDDRFRVPTVHVALASRGESAGEGEAFEHDYSMRLQFARVEDGQVNTRLYLSLPDAQRSWVAGYFKTEIPIDDDGEMSLTEILDDSPAIPEPSPSPLEELEAIRGRANVDEMTDEEFQQAIGLDPNADALTTISAFPQPYKGLAFAASALTVFAWFWMVVVAFREHWGWGLLMFLPILGPLVFLIARFGTAWKPVFAYGFSSVLLLIVTFLGGFNLARQTIEQWEAEAAAAQEPATFSSVLPDPAPEPRENGRIEGAERRQQQLETFGRPVGD